MQPTWFATGGDGFRICEETGKFNEQVGVRNVTNTRSPNMGALKICDEPESPKEGTRFGYVINRDRQITGRV